MTATAGLETCPKRRRRSPRYPTLPYPPCRCSMYSCFKSSIAGVVHNPRYTTPLPLTPRKKRQTAWPELTKQGQGFGYGGRQANWGNADVANQAYGRCGGGKFRKDKTKEEKNTREVHRYIRIRDPEPRSQEHNRELFIPQGARTNPHPRPTTRQELDGLKAQAVNICEEEAKIDGYTSGVLTASVSSSSVAFEMGRPSRSEQNRTARSAGQK